VLLETGGALVLESKDSSCTGRWVQDLWSHHSMGWCVVRVLGVC